MSIFFFFFFFFSVKSDSWELLAGYDRTVADPHPGRLRHLMPPRKGA